MRPKRDYFSTIAFYDMLFILVLGLFAFFILSMLQIKPESKKADIETKAEYVITVTWPQDNKDDVDTWLRDPTGKVMYYSNKEITMAHLDRDDRGYVTDYVKLADGSIVVYPYNQEITTIRGTIAGEWILNLHMYSKIEPGPTEVKVKIDKLNPITKVVFSKTVLLSFTRQEVTVVRFEMTEQGYIITFNNLPMSLVKYAK